MKWSIHHVNLVAHDVDESRRFYRDIIGLENGPTENTIGKGSQNLDLAGRVAVVGDGNRGLHLNKPIPDFSKRVGLPMNPAVGGHLALSVPDVEALKQRLTEANVFFVDAGEYAMPGVVQLYLYDPSGNLIEINQDSSPQ